MLDTVLVVNNKVMAHMQPMRHVITVNICHIVSHNTNDNDDDDDDDDDTDDGNNNNS